MSDQSQVNATGQNDNGHAVQPSEPRQSHENSPDSPRSVEAMPASTQAIVVSQGLEKNVQKADNQITPAKIAPPPASIASAPLKEEDTTQKLGNLDESSEVTQRLTPVEPVPNKPDRTAEEAKDHSAPPEIAPNSLEAEPAHLSREPHKITLEAIPNDVQQQAHLLEPEANMIQSDDSISQEDKTQRLIPQIDPSAVVQPAQTTPSSPVEQTVAHHQEIKPAEHGTASRHLDTPATRHDGEKDEDHHHKPEAQIDDEEGEEEEEEEEGILSFLHERRFTFKGMSRPQRVISGIAIGQLLVSAILILFNFLPRPFIQISILSGSRTIGISTIAFIAVLIFYLLSWSYLLSGALHGHVVMRILVLAIFTFIQILISATSPIEPPVMLLASIVLLGILWGWGLAVFLIERRTTKRQKQQDAQVREFIISPDWGLYLPTFLPVLALLFIYYALLLGFCLWFGTDTISANLYLFYQMIEATMALTTLFLIPVLFLAGTDFAELGEAIMQSGARVINRIPTRAPWFLVFVNALFAAYIAFKDLPDRALNIGNWLGSLFSQLIIGAGIVALLGGVVYLAGLYHWPSFHMKRAGLQVKTRILILAMTIVLIFGTLIPLSTATIHIDMQHPLPLVDTLNFSIYKQSDVQPNFSLAYPSGWHTAVMANNKELTTLGFDGTNSNPPSLFFVVRHSLDPHLKNPFPENPQNDLKQFFQVDVCPSCSFVPRQTTTQGPWLVIHYTENKEAGIAWIRDLNGQRWMLTGSADQNAITQAGPVFTAIVDSWRADLKATIPPADNTQNNELQTISSLVTPFSNGLLPLLVGVLALLLLLQRRKRPDLIAVGALFFIVLGILQFSYYLPQLIVLLIPQVHLGFYFSSVLLTVSVGTLVALCWLLIKRKITSENTNLLTLLLVLNGGLWFVSFMYWLYSRASDSGLNQTGTIILQALLLGVAFGWDIFTSGESMNKGKSNFPRHTRLLLFLGYIMLASTAVLYFSSQVSLPGGVLLPPDKLFFDSENWPQVGILRLGAPLIITTFILQVTYWWGSRNPQLADEKTVNESTTSNGRVELRKEAKQRRAGC